MADGHQCTCGDPGEWSTIDGRNFNDLLVRVGAPSGWLQANRPTRACRAAGRTGPVEQEPVFAQILDCIQNR